MAVRSRGCARAAKGNDLIGEKSGAFGAMMTFRRTASTSGLDRVEQSPTRRRKSPKLEWASAQRGCARAAKGNGL